MDTTTTMDTATLLGRAPYRINVHAKAATGTCARCGREDTILMEVVAADGTRSLLGTSCANRMIDTSGTLKRAVRRVVAARRNAKVDEAIAGVVAALADESLRARLAALPAPRGRGTILSWAEYVLARGGRSGKARVAKAIAAL